jgi:hypothetical protein
MKTPNILYLSIYSKDHAIKWTDAINRWHVGSELQRRPAGLQTFNRRLQATWLVFTGRADALIWPEEK